MKERRNLDGVYFRFGKDNICFSDMTEEQQDEVMEGRSEEWLKSMCKILAGVIYQIGEEFDIICKHGDDE